MTFNEFEAALDLARRLNRALPSMTEEQRQQLFKEVTEGYCTACANALGARGRCYCQRDD